LLTPAGNTVRAEVSRDMALDPKVKTEKVVAEFEAFCEDCCKRTPFGPKSELSKQLQA